MNNPQFRPPAEANSLILQVDKGCPHNRCTFCRMYRDVKYQRLSLEEVQALIRNEARYFPDASRIFLADGDVMLRSFEDLQAILQMLNNQFPRLARVNVYANGSSIDSKTDDQLLALRSLKLQTLYMGLESGDEEILKQCRKGETACRMIDAGIKAQKAGLRMSVMILLGLGGADRTAEHARHTADALTRMQPRLVSALRVIPVKGTELCEDVKCGRFHQLTEYQTVQELKAIIEAANLNRAVFRANHSSNIIPLEGRLPQDKARLLAALDDLLASRALDTQSPGPMPMWL